MLGGPAVGRPPEHYPHQAGQPRDYKRRLPAPVKRDKGDHGRRHDGPDIGPGVKNPCCQRAFFLGEPLRDGLDRRREIARFADAETKTGQAEAESGARQRMGCGGDGPHGEVESVSDSGSDPVYEPSGKEESYGVGECERTADIAVMLIRPSDFGSQCGRQDPQHRAIDVIDGRGKKEQRADNPAVTAYFCLKGCFQQGVCCLLLCHPGLFQSSVLRARDDTCSIKPGSPSARRGRH